ncbi:hypothetical protein TNIN_477911 [Trichonephila inaurata madagascariensis]|uniref:Uncharacterized protein n=1 Tax=Trichonephila inaurata madagascariensis TaxID=2747483 RepID=A0A8X7C3G1_9ARAC|nr:hypothetical protein TNIN_477911 [Trichonephila inaurata madagascariensis]
MYFRSLPTQPLEHRLPEPQSIPSSEMTSRWRCHFRRSIFSDASTVHVIFENAVAGPLDGRGRCAVVHSHHTGRSRLKCPPLRSDLCSGDYPQNFDLQSRDAGLQRC